MAWLCVRGRSTDGLIATVTRSAPCRWFPILQGPAAVKLYDIHGFRDDGRDLDGLNLCLSALNAAMPLMRAARPTRAVLLNILLDAGPHLRRIQTRIFAIRLANGLGVASN